MIAVSMRMLFRGWWKRLGGLGRGILTDFDAADVAGVAACAAAAAAACVAGVVV